ncbi:MAG: sigma-70 family RNA polymerase sigma factor [bacterium]|nr:sigma-70 family RNA polymerase sigma factor [bacterium]
MAEESTDTELIEATLGGREEAFEMLMKRYERFVYKLAFGFGRSHENALDLSQTIFLKVYRKLSLFQGQSSFRTWLAKVAYHEGLNWRRANRRHLDGREELTQVADSGSTPQDQGVLKEERTRLVLGGLAQLNRRYRTAIELRYFHGMGVREIASVLGCSEGVAKNALFRGIRRLRSQLAQA